MRLLLVPITIMFASSGVMLGQGIITSMAGTDFQGFSGDGGPATAAQLYSPQNATVDSAGTVYFADTVNYRIRKITSDGIITTVAGNGLRGTTGDGGPALNARLGLVYQVAWTSVGTPSSAGRLCFGDYDAYKIRCVDLTGGTIVGFGTGNAMSDGDGGPVGSASFYFPMGAAFDSAGNFYLSDFAANRVRRVDAVTGLVSTIAGGGTSGLGDGGPATQATLSFPRGLCYSNGSLYIADQSNSRVRRVDLATGIIATVAGNGTPYSAGDGGPATLAGMTPAWVAADGVGNLFIADKQAVRMVNLSGVISTVAGGPYSGWGYDDIPAIDSYFSGLQGVAWDPIARRLLMSDYSGRIRQVFFTTPTNITLNVSPNPAIPGQAVTLQATVSPSVVTGSVRFHNGYALLGSAAISGGTANFTWTPTGGTNYSLRAVYGGDATYNLSGSSIVTLTSLSSSSVVLTSTPNPSIAGSPVNLTATVTPAVASGTVQFFNGPALLGSASLSGGKAQLSTSTLPVGTNALTAVYVGDGAYARSSSTAINQVVQAVTTTTLSNSPNPSTYGSPVTLTATVTPATATGAIQFFNGVTPLGSANLASGRASIIVSLLPSGTDSLTAAYSGDPANAASASSTQIQMVNKGSSTTALTATPASTSSSGQPVTFTASVTPSASTGVVQFLDGSVLIGSATLSGGTATFSTSALANGNHAIKASYGGDANVNGSQSATLSYKVKR